MTAIEREAGSHLEGLSVSIRELRGSIAPGRVSMHGFERLRKLNFPSRLRCVMSLPPLHVGLPPRSANRWLSEMAQRNTTNWDEDEPFISDLVPASVFQLSLISSGPNDHAKALDVMFRDFAARKKSTSPTLEEIILTSTISVDDAYKEKCDKLHAETEKAGVVLHLMPWLSFATITWDGEQ